MNQFHYRTCHLCETMCGIEVEHDGKQIIAIRGDKDDILSKGNICPKATGLQDIYTDPDRLRKPMKRVRKNPAEKSHEDEWVEIEWEEAFEYTAESLADIQLKYGTDALASYSGRSVAHNIGLLLTVPAVRKVVGSKNIYTGSTCDQMPHNFVWHHMLGHQFLCTIPDLKRTDYYLMLGTNPKVSNGAMMSTGANTYKKLNEIRERGGKTILIDPRRTETAKYVNEHHFIKPNTDALFLIGIIKTIFANGLANPGKFVNHITGWDAVKSMVASFELEQIAAVTGIARADIERIGIEFAGADKAICYGRTGLSMVEFGGVCQWLMQIVNIITANMDVEGGLMFPRTAIDSLSLTASSWDLHRSRVSQRPEFSEEFPMAILPEEILTPGEGRIRGLIGMGGNMVLSMADGHKSEEALQDLEFMVSFDYYLNETTRFSDIIMPPVSTFEHEHCDMFYHFYDTINWYKWSPPLFEAEKPGYSDFEVIREVLCRLAVKRAKNPIKKAIFAGIGKLARKLTISHIIAAGVRFGPYGKGLNPFKKDALSLQKLKDNPHGVFLGELEPSMPDRLFTKDKNIHLAPQVLMDDLPRLRQRFLEGGEGPLQPNDEFDLQIISKLTNRTLGWMHHSYRLVKGKNPVRLTINPEDASSRGISADSIVKVSSPRASIELPVDIDADIMPGVVCMPHLWGHNRPGTKQRVANATPGVSMNDLSDVTNIDELTGTVVLNGYPVKVEAISISDKEEETHADETVEEYVA